MPVIEFYGTEEEIKKELESAQVGAFNSSLTNAKTPSQATEMFKLRLEDKKVNWAAKQVPKIDFQYKIIATFKDFQNETYWNCLVSEKINQFSSTKLYYSAKGFLKKRNLSKDELEVFKQQIQGLTNQPTEQPTEVKVEEKTEVKAEVKAEEKKAEHKKKGRR